MKPQHPRQWLLIGYGLIICLLVSLVSIPITRFNFINEQLDLIVNEHSRQASLVHSMISAARERIVLLSKLVATKDSFERDDYFMAFREQGSRFAQHYQALTAIELQEDERALLNKQTQLTDHSLGIQYRIIDLVDEGATEQASVLLYQQAIPAQDAVLAVLQQLTELQKQRNQATQRQASEQIRTTIRHTLPLLGLLMLFLSALITLYISRRITRMIKAQNQTEAELRDTQAREHAILQNMIDAVISINSQGQIASCNPAAEKMFGYTEAELLGKDVSILMPSAYRSEHRTQVKRFMATQVETVTGKTRDQIAIHRDGHHFPVDIGITSLELGGEKMVVGILRDITERKQAEASMQRSHDELEHLVAQRTRELKEANERLTHLACHDSLTGLANRTVLGELLKSSMAIARRHRQHMALLYLDLDGFKVINDQLGHQAGDHVLQSVAQRLTATVRTEDTVARVGGDEFIICMGNLKEPMHASLVAEKIIQAIAQPYEYEGRQLHLGVSIGISLYPDDSDSADGLIGRADAAMYQMKKCGKNGYRFAHEQVPGTQPKGESPSVR